MGQPYGRRDVESARRANQEAFFAREPLRHGPRVGFIDAPRFVVPPNRPCAAAAPGADSLYPVSAATSLRQRGRRRGLECDDSGMTAGVPQRAGHAAQHPPVPTAPQNASILPPVCSHSSRPMPM